MRSNHRLTVHISSGSRQGDNSSMIRCHASLLVVLCCMAGSLLAQTFQYSRGWTNGRKRAPAPPGPQTPSAREAACQLQKLRIILEGKNTQQLYWPCDWQDVSPDYEAHHMQQTMDPDGN